ncbi:MAG: PxxKW family cysteine-rich protein [Desulfobacteraceae bacterium]
MICATVKEGEECVFMASGGCSFNGGSCRPVVEACDGCSRVKEYADGRYCTASPDPAVKWKNGNCNMATHLKFEAAGKTQKVNPIKASKRK